MILERKERSCANHSAERFGSEMQHNPAGVWGEIRRGRINLIDLEDMYVTLRLRLLRSRLSSVLKTELLANCKFSSLKTDFQLILMNNYKMQLLQNA